MSNILKLSSVNSKKIAVRFKNEIDELKDQKDAKLNPLQIQLEQRYELGYKTGYEDAKNNFEKVYREKFIKKVDEFNKILSSIDEKMLLYDKDFDELVIQLSFEIAQRIVRKEIRKETIIENVLKDSLRKVLGANSVIIKIHPEDFNFLNSDNKTNIFLGESFSKIKFEQDERIEQGGCVVETEIGNVDARIISQFIELKKIFELN